MFAIAMDDTLYLKADAETAPAFEAEGLEVFRFKDRPPRSSSTAYRQAPESVFEDEDGRMNLAAADAGGQFLCVSNFTLYGDTRTGNRPSFVEAAAPADAEPLYDRVREGLGALGGRFGARMALELVNDGPVTVIVEA